MAEHKKLKYQEKPKPPVYYNFSFDPQSITINTAIPDLPEKSKPKPDEKAHEKKIKQLQSRLEKLKQSRQLKKAQLLKLGIGFEEQSKKLEDNIDMGNKCIQVLQYDLEQIEENITDLQAKIDKKTSFMKKLQREDKVHVSPDKDYEDMTYGELDSIIYKLQVRISTQDLNKRQENQLNNLIAKLKRLQKKAPEGGERRNNDEKIYELRTAIQNLKDIKKREQMKLTQIKYKIQCIEEDVSDFEDEFDQLQEKRKNPELEQIQATTKKLKNEILELREQKAQVEQNFLNKQEEYNYEQKKIEWIIFATKIKEQRIAEWEAEKAELRKKKMYNNKNKNKDEKEKEGENKEETPYVKPVINKHQKDIDACTFLISYCKDLYPKAANESVQKEEKKIDLNKCIKQGDWAKMKVELVKSKKENEDEATPKQTRKRKNRKHQPEGTKEEVEGPEQKKITHSFFIEKIFDTLKVSAPSTHEELEKTIEEIQDKLDYFILHPDAPRPHEEKDTPKRSYVNQKYKKVSNLNKVIKREDFPSLP